MTCQITTHGTVFETKSFLVISVPDPRHFGTDPDLYQNPVLLGSKFFFIII